MIGQYISFISNCVRHLWSRPLIFVSFIVVSVAAALTEGISMSLLVPLLDAGQQGSSISNTPVLGVFSQHIGDLPLNDRLRLIAGLLAVVLLLRGLLLYILEVLSGTAPAYLLRDLSVRSYGGLIRADILHTINQDYGLLTSGVTELPARVAHLLMQFCTIISSALVLAVYGSLMLAVSPGMTLAAIAFLGALSTLMRFYQANLLRGYGQELTKATATAAQVVRETLNGLKMIHLAAAESQMLNRYNAAADHKLRSHRKQILIMSGVNPIMSTSVGVFICGLLFINATVREAADTSWLGGILVFLFLMFRLTTPVANINSARARIAGEIAAFEQMRELFEQAEAGRQLDGEHQISTLAHGIRLEAVSFSYPGVEGRTIKDVTLEIPRGKTVALVGPSGAGKSTLTGLLTRLYDPQAGCVLVDGTDLRSLDLATWRRMVGVVTQDIFIFDDTVRNNIAFAREGVTDAEIERAIRLSAVDQFLLSLPQGIDTILGDRGVRLSGGQQQRLAIARAIVAHPPILILDEATSHLDSFTETAIQAALDELRGDRTIIVVAHRLATIQKADLIVVMREGEIVQQGSHAELLERRGLYADLLSCQQL